MSKRSEQMFHQRRYTNGIQAYKKMFYIIRHQEIQIKATKEYYYILIRRPKFRILTTPYACKDIEQEELSFIARGNANGTASLEDSLAVSSKTKHNFTIWCSNLAPRYLPKGVENVCTHKNLHLDVYSSFIHNCQILDVTMMSYSGERLSKLWYIWTMDSYSVPIRSEPSTHRKTWRNLKCILLSERNQPEKATYYMSPNIWHFGKSKSMK